MELTLPDDLVTQIKAAAQAENREPADLLRDLLARHRDAQPPRTAREVRQRIYAQARAYWNAHNMSDHAALTDDELDEVFDFIDGEGVPHLKQDAASRSTDPLQGLIGVLDTNADDLSASVRDTLGTFYQERYERPD